MDTLSDEERAPFIEAECFAGRDNGHQGQWVEGGSHIWLKCDCGYKTGAGHSDDDAHLQWLEHIVKSGVVVIYPEVTVK
ncbi:MAG: hypothetical protein KIH67_002575 [Candidatus Moranbacteria bacterium]|nr:hypothetical protein [Candidatus Moranbacteria bacterium]